MSLYQLPDDRIVTADMPFVFDGVQYPQNWLRLASSAEIAALGITVLPDPEPPAPPPPNMVPVQLAAVAGSYRSNLRRKAETLQAEGDTYGAVQLLLKATGVKS